VAPLLTYVTSRRSGISPYLCC